MRGEDVAHRVGFLDGLGLPSVPRGSSPTSHVSEVVVSTRWSQQVEHMSILPASGRRWVLMKNTFAVVQLLTVDVDHLS